MSKRTAHRPRAKGSRVRQPALLLLLVAIGCASSNKWVRLRDTPSNPLTASLGLLSSEGAKPTPRTAQLLRRYNLADQLQGDRAALIAQLDDLQAREAHPEHEYAMAELAYLAAQKYQATNSGRALEFYGTALMHIYRYLFDETGDYRPNPYDPQFRGASELYNQSLEGVLQIVRKQGELKPGTTRRIETANHECTFDIVVRGSGWDHEDFDRFEFVSDYQIEGLRNHYRGFGLGVPLIAIRRPHAGEHPAEAYYPSSLAFPVTAFLRVTASSSAAAHPDGPRFTLELVDPLEQPGIEVAGRTVPLESDLSTPLAYFLSQPELSETDIGTVGLLFPDRVQPLQGLYMLEPYDPRKMPVVMVHGLWSSPLTWMEMFNDLRSDPLVRENYQFWFYLYPTGQPFWLSATQMRADLREMRDHIDPRREAPALDQTVLIGHSMGGLVSRLQSVDSGSDFWQTVSERPLVELKADEQLRTSLAAAFFFQPNPSVRRVVSIGTPYRGSRFANGVTRWAGRKLIALPKRLMHFQEQLLAGHRDFFRPDAPLDIKTSIDSLSPESPLLPVLLAADPGPWVRFHNIVGRAPAAGWREYIVGEGDGVVSLDSAKLPDTSPVRSQITVPSDHVSLHRHPQSILEVRRILLEQLAELKSFPHDVQVASADIEVAATPTPTRLPAKQPGETEIQRLPPVVRPF